MVGEIGSGIDILASNVLNPFRREKSLPWDKSLPTIMLLHGYMIGAPSLRGLTNHLDGAGFNTWCENHHYKRHLDTIESEVGWRLDSICQNVGDRIKIVGHSQGGLVACALAQKHPDKVSTMVALGAPFGGTYVAYLNYFVPGARDMLPGSAYLKEIQEGEFPEEVQFVSIHSPYDEALLMKDSGKLPERENARMPKRKNVRNIRADDVGHGGLIGKNNYFLIETLLRDKV